MAPMGWMLLVGLAAGGQVDELAPGDFTIKAGTEEVLVKRVVFRISGDLLTITGGQRPGIQMSLARRGTSWTLAQGADASAWLNASRGGRLQRVTLRVDSDLEERLQGSWSGTLVDRTNRSTVVSGRFDLAAPGSFDAKPGIVLGGLGCMLLAILLVVNAGVSIWFVVTAFRESVCWGVAVLLLPFANIIFTVLYWDAAKRPFLASLGTAAASILVLGFVIMVS